MMVIVFILRRRVCKLRNSCAPLTLPVIRVWRVENSIRQKHEGHDIGYRRSEDELLGTCTFWLVFRYSWLECVLFGVRHCNTRPMIFGYMHEESRVVEMSQTT